jgi:hypothetical protein
MPECGSDLRDIGHETTESVRQMTEIVSEITQIVGESTHTGALCHLCGPGIRVFIEQITQTNALASVS